MPSAASLYTLDTFLDLAVGRNDAIADPKSSRMLQPFLSILPLRSVQLELSWRCAWLYGSFSFLLHSNAEDIHSPFVTDSPQAISENEMLAISSTWLEDLYAAQFEPFVPLTALSKHSSEDSQSLQAKFMVSDLANLDDINLFAGEHPFATEDHRMLLSREERRRLRVATVSSPSSYPHRQAKRRRLETLPNSRPMLLRDIHDAHESHSLEGMLTL